MKKEEVGRVEEGGKIFAKICIHRSIITYIKIFRKYFDLDTKYLGILMNDNIIKSINI